MNDIQYCVKCGCRINGYETYCTECAKLFTVLNDPSVHNFTKSIIRAGLTKDPVDAIGDVELALKILKAEFKRRRYHV